MRVAKACHVDLTSGHLGIEKTVARVKERFMWKGIMMDIKSVSVHASVNNFIIYSL